MSGLTIRPAYSMWPQYNRRLREVVAAMTEAQLAIPVVGHGPTPSDERWPIWATIGHTACQRVFWLCDFAGEPGADTTPFTNAAYNCPGDDDLEHVLTADELVQGLESSFKLVETCLDRWTLDMLPQEIRRPDFGDDWVHTRGAVIQRVFSHDVYHCGELSQALGLAGLPQIDLWD
jgi:DinB superfamily